MSRIRQHASALRVFLLALFVYGLSAQVWTHAVSLAPHYVYLAQSLLHGHVDLIQLPPTTYDLLQFNGRWFVAGSPMPSILMLPFVAIFGTGFSDVLFSIVLGAIDVALVYSLLGVFIHNRATEAQRKAGNAPSLCASVVISESARRWITLLFALGTPFWYLASLGTYWFTAHVVVVFFALLATREALTKQRWFLVGLWLACAGFARPTALFLAPFFLIIMLYAARRSSLRFTPYVLRSLAPFVLALTILASRPLRLQLRPLQIVHRFRLCLRHGRGQHHECIRTLRRIQSAFRAVQSGRVAALATRSEWCGAGVHHARLCVLVGRRESIGCFRAHHAESARDEYLLRHAGIAADLYHFQNAIR